MARGVPSRERASIGATLIPVCGALPGWTVISLATRGTPMVTNLRSDGRGGDPNRHGSRRLPTRGEKRAGDSLFATMNVCGGMKSKEDEVCDMMNERGIDVLCVTETNRRGQGNTTLGAYSAYWSGVHDTDRASKGVGIVLSERMAKCVTDYECVNPRVIWVRMKVGMIRLYVVGVYAPHTGLPPSEREDFWKSVKDVLTKCKENERIVMLGDFNGWIGVQRDGYERVLGKFGDVRINENGECLLEVCLERSLFVTNTFFCHKEIHMYTWQREKERSMIDYIIVDERMRGMIVDTRVYRGLNVGTDHYLVMSRVRGLSKTWRRHPKVFKTELERIKVERLNEKETKEEYARRLNESFERIMPEDSVEEVWTAVRTGMVEIASEMCGTSKRKNGRVPNVIWDDEVKNVVSDKKKAWKDLLSTRANVRQQRISVVNDEVVNARRKYDVLKKRVKEVYERKKVELKERNDRNFTDNFRTNVKLFWKLVKNARGRTSSGKVSCIRNEDGCMLTREDEVLRQWKRYFESMLNCEDGVNETPEVDSSPVSGMCVNDDNEINVR